MLYMIKLLLSTDPTLVTVGIGEALFSGLSKCLELETESCSSFFKLIIISIDWEIYSTI